MVALSSWPGFDPRTSRWVRFAAALTALVGSGLLYLLSAPFQLEVDVAARILGRGDVAALRDYVDVLLIAFGVVIAGGIITAIVRRRRQGKPAPLRGEEGAIEEDEQIL